VKTKYIQICYDARPIISEIKKYKAKITKQTKTGFKVENIDAPGLYEDVIFYSNGTARGWKTLTWQPITSEVK